jgi:hypothetical protein
MTNKDFFKKIDKKKIKSKKTVDGYYSDKTGFYTLYKDENGKTTIKKEGKK